MAGRAAVARSAPTSGPGRSALVLLLLLVAGAAAASAEEERNNVLVLYAMTRNLPAHAEVGDGLQQALQNLRPPVEIFEEYLDLPRFSRPEHFESMVAYLREKYVSRPPRVLVIVGSEALRFALEHRSGLFPHVPIVHVVIERNELATLPPLPPDVVGTFLEFDFRGTIEAALTLRPRTHRLLFVTGCTPRDRRWEGDLRRAAAGFAARATLEFAACVSRHELRDRITSAGDDTAIVTPGYFADADGNFPLPREAVREMAAEATAPLYGPFVTFLDTGVVGGSMIEFESIGREAGREVAELLRGTAPAEIRLADALPSSLILDWRQLERWGIARHRVPPGAIVRFEPPRFLDLYLRETIVAGVVVAIQTLLIVLLLAERRRHRASEIARQQLRGELHHASRLAIAGELIGSIAHEINQPLGAILSNADTADLLLDSGADRTADLRVILGDIRRDDRRASETIRRLRGLLAKRELESQSFDLDDAVRDAENLLRPEARRRGVALELRASAVPARIHGDRLQIQQVVINLVLNAMDAVTGLSESRRRVELEVARGDGGAVVTVRDRGPGITGEILPKLFESFFTTKSQGMGLGLPISRTIVEAHGGRIRVEGGEGSGAAFHVELPLAEGRDSPLPESR